LLVVWGEVWSMRVVGESSGWAGDILDVCNG
jgi:hypothetical protein